MKFCICLMLILPFPCFGLELMLNDRQIAVLTEDTLREYAVPEDMEEGLLTVPLSFFFPWFQNIDSLEVKAGTELWNQKELSLADDQWNAIKFVFQDKNWALWLGEKQIVSPEKILLYGNTLSATTVQIWSKGKYETTRHELKAALLFRGIKLYWREIEQPMYLINNPPEGILPHIILLDDINLIRLKLNLVKHSPFRTRSLDVFNSLQGSNIYKPETALHWLLAENSQLFDGKNPLPKKASHVITFLKEMRKSNNKETHFLVYNEETTPILLNSHAAIPLGLTEAEYKIAIYLLEEILRFSNQKQIEGGIPLPLTAQTLRYFEAYTRIGRLAIADQLDETLAIKQINEYVNDPFFEFFEPDTILTAERLHTNQYKIQDISSYTFHSEEIANKKKSLARKIYR